jgi:outer membrane protein assembly factor BamB
MRKYSLGGGALGALLLAGAALASACGSSSSGSGATSSPTSTVEAPASTSTSTTSTSSASASPAAAGPASALATSAGWPTYDHDGARSGLSTSTPAFGGKLDRSWTRTVSGDVYAQPLVVGGKVVVATEADEVYDLSETTGRVAWRRTLASAVPGGLPCGNILPTGITGTPVADVAANRLFVVTFSTTGGYHHTLWALDLTTGRTVWDRTIDVPGTDTLAEQQRGALTLLDGRVYVPFGGLYGDCSDYKGRVASVEEATGDAFISFTTANQRQAGLWSPPGPAVRANSLYVATGNGTPYDQVDDSDSVLRLSPKLALVDRFTPTNYVSLSTDDLDLGSTSPVLLPDGLVFEAGKQGVGYLLDGTHLGGTGGQLASAQACDGGFGGAAVDGDTLFLSCFNQLAAIGITPPTGGHRAALRVEWRAPIGAGPPIIAGGIVWDVTRQNQLVGLRPATGHQVVAITTGAVVTSFPTLSASGSRLFVPEGNQVVTYTGA